MTSLALPAVSGTITRIGLDGQVCEDVCAETCVQVALMAASAIPAAMNQRPIFILLKRRFSVRP
jgi:hypothetical protein